MRSYKKSLAYIVKGHIGLVLCLYDTIMENKVLTMLVLSLVFNFSLIVALANERMERDKMSSELVELEMIKDSLNKKTHTNISYRYY